MSLESLPRCLEILPREFSGYADTFEDLLLSAIIRGY